MVETGAFDAQIKARGDEPRSTTSGTASESSLCCTTHRVQHQCASKRATVGHRSSGLQCHYDRVADLRQVRGRGLLELIREGSDAILEPCILTSSRSSWTKCASASVRPSGAPASQWTAYTLCAKVRSAHKREGGGIVRLRRPVGHALNSSGKTTRRPETWRPLRQRHAFGVHQLVEFKGANDFYALSSEHRLLRQQAMQTARAKEAPKQRCSTHPRVVYRLRLASHDLPGS